MYVYALEEIQNNSLATEPAYTAYRYNTAP